ncbi:MAG: alpha/beta fold hydrolase [Ktedonobacteraceae bacterium]
MPMKPVRDEFLIAGDVTLHYVQWGEQGQPIICVHGLTANAFYFQAIADDVAIDHRVFAYDLRGRGDSDKPEQGYSVPIHATDLAACIDELGLERPILIGHSLGALISLYFAAHYPDKLSKLILLDAGTPLPWKTAAEQPAWLTAAIERLGTTVSSFQEYISRLKAAPFLGPYWNEYMDIYFNHDVLHENDGSVMSKCYKAGVLEEATHFDEAKPEQQWAHVTVPTLLLRAGQGLFFENDQLVPESSAEEAQRSIRNCRYVNFPALNHYTIVFSAEQGPLQHIRTFIEEEQ